MHPARVLVPSALVLLSLGCGSSTMGTGDCGMTGSTGSGGGAPSKTASVLVGEMPAAASSQASYIVGASFAPQTPDVGDTYRCKSQVDGACSLTTCAGSSGKAPPSQAGAILASSPETHAEITPDASGDYSTATGTSLFWDSPGETITASAAGGEIPAFMIATPAPASITLTAPTFPATGPGPTVDTSHDLVVAWSGSGPGQVEISVSPPLPTCTTAPDVSVDCTFDVSAGQGVVPASLMSQLQKGTGGAFGVIVGSTATTSAGDYSIALTAVVVIPIANYGKVVLQ